MDVTHAETVLPAPAARSGIETPSQRRAPRRCIAAALALVGCSGAEAPPPLPPPSLGETRAVIPGPGLPGEYTELRDQLMARSNNNLDVVRHGGQVYLATRLSKDHFASKDSWMFVFSSRDEQTWRFETRISLGADVREPRLLSYRGRLFLYLAKLGTNPTSFEPQGMLVSEQLSAGSWTAPAGFYHDGEPYIPWRAKERSGTAFLIAYKNGEHIYDFTGLPMSIELLRSTDGRSYAPIDPSRPAVLRGGGSECDFELDDRGDLYAVVRNEAGDSDGYGSKICTASAADLASFRCNTDPRKYDSPLVFRHRGRIFLIARRNVTETGNYALHPGAPWSVSETILNLADYSAAPKRCALWEVDRETLTVRHLLDVPGWGDTCFPSVLYPEGESGAALPPEAGPRTLILYNYSSPLDDPENAERPWSVAQRNETRIYRTELLMP